MKISLNWIRFINEKYRCAADPAPDGIEALVEKIGAQLGAVEEVINLGERYKGIVIVKVVSCEKHPDADKLSVCLIDDGGAVPGIERVSGSRATRASAVSVREGEAEEAVQKSTATEHWSSQAENVPQSGGVSGSAGKQVGRSRGLVQVVCGAPNVEAGMLAVWIPPGAAVPSTYDKDPIIVGSRQIRVIASNGMLASPKELDLGDDHSGLLTIDVNTKPGQPFAEVYKLDDYVIDIENKMFTHRPDLFGQLGIARELAGIQGHSFKSPSWYRIDPTLPNPNGPITHPLAGKNVVPKAVP